MSKIVKSKGEIQKLLSLIVISILITFFGMSKALAYYQKTDSKNLGFATKTYSNLTLALDKTVYPSGNNAATVNLTLTNSNDYNVTYTLSFSNNTPTYTIDGAPATTYTVNANSSKTNVIQISGATGTSITISVNVTRPYSATHTKVANFDNSNPSCTFGSLNTIKVGTTQTLELTCTDSSGISTSTLTSSAFTLSNGNVSIQSISSTTVTNGYKYTLTLLGNTVGTTNISLNAGAVLDGTGNGNTSISTQATIQNPEYTVTYNANGGTFGSNTTNQVTYEITRGTVTKYSHTSNISDAGVQSGNYGNNWTSANITGTDRGDTSQAHVVTIEGSSSLHVVLTYAGESANWDWVSLWSGSHPDYTAASDYSTGVKLGGNTTGKYGGGTGTTVEGDISGDTVTFAFKSDGGGVGNGYGYYAIITGEGSTATVVNGTYSDPTKTRYEFQGWYTNQACTDGNEFNPNNLSSNITVYAKWKQNVFDVTYNANGGTFGSNTTNQVAYEITRGTVTKYSHTSNISDAGVQSGNYGNNWTSANITGTERGDTTKAHVVTIEGASSLHVVLTYAGESVNRDWVSLWAGSHPDYTAAVNYSTGVRLGSNITGKYGGGTGTTVEGDIEGDTVTFAFKSDGSGVGNGYGYYAVITGEGNIAIVVSGTYSEPTKTDYAFKGWYTDQACTDGNEFNPDSLSSDITVYAKWLLKESTFLPGQDFNAKLKRLSGQSNATASTTNTTITSFEKTNILSITPTDDNIVSTRDSIVPIYAWYNNGVIYYYTTAVNTYLNADARGMFEYMKAFSNADLSLINTSRTTDMNWMFFDTGYNATTFSLDLSGWDVSNVVNMQCMFYDLGYSATTWSIRGLEDWDVSSVTTMAGMFKYAGRNATIFNLDLSDWIPSSLEHMEEMFRNSGYNSTTFSIGDLSDWDTSSVINMSYAFSYAGYNSTTWNIGDLSDWNTSHATNMSYMFYCSGYNVSTFSLDLSNWDTSHVTNMSYMFNTAGFGATIWSIEGLENWDVSSVENMSYMFSAAGYNAGTFSLDISNWNTTSVTNMYSMFSSAGYRSSTFNLDLSDWDVSSVGNMDYMFSSTGYSASTWSIGDLSDWNLSSVSNMISMFYRAGYSAGTFNLGDLSNWNAPNLEFVTSMFSAAGYSAGTFNIDLSSFDTSHITDMRSMFYEAGYSAGTFNLDLSGWDTSNVTTMTYMLASAGRNASTWSIEGLEDWDVSSVTNMASMFSSAGYNAGTFNLDLSDWDVSSALEVSQMFSRAGYSATTWSIGNLSGWDTSSVTTMDTMFNEAGHSAETWSLGDLSDWDVSHVTSMSSMFYHAGHSAGTWSLGDLSDWDTSSVSSFRSMFEGAGYQAEIFNISYISNWDVSGASDIAYMFADSGHSATTWNIGDLSSWDTSSVTNMSHMFYNAGKSATTWNSIGTLKVYTIDIGYIFYMSHKANGTLNIYSNPTYYSYAFSNAATSGNGIVVNYSSTTTNIDAIIATKSSTSNVVKGSQLN